jgi:hypothetical protein
MKNKFGFIAALALAVTFVSCQKELSIDTLGSAPGGGTGGGNNASLIGTWKMLDLTANTESDVEVSDGISVERALTVTDYKTMNNKGTITFDATKMTSSGLGYDINDTAFSYLYSDGVLIDSIDFPFQFSIPSSSGQTNYKVVGSDSLYFESGSFSVPGTDPQASQASGARYRIDGDILTMTSSSVSSDTESSQGVTTKTRNKLTAVIRMQKQ